MIGIMRHAHTWSNMVKVMSNFIWCNPHKPYTKNGNTKFDNMALHYSGRILLICDYSGRILLICDLTNAYMIMFINVFDKLMMKT